MIKANITISEQNLLNGFTPNGYEYQTICDTLEHSKQSIKDVIWECIEIDGIVGDNLIEVIYENNETEEFIIHVDKIIFTNKPSKFIKWGNKIPHLFTVDRNKSIVVNEELNLPLGV